jgi:hypothetical protein
VNRAEVEFDLHRVKAEYFAAAYQQHEIHFEPDRFCGDFA